jgi:uncharacterized SAM-binding protein YcdF (DUF218 family)
MFYTVSKLLTVFLMPFVWVFVCLLLGFWFRKTGRGVKYYGFGFLLFMVFGNFWLAATVSNAWENRYKFVDVNSKYDVAIVLGGGIIDEHRRPYSMIHFDQSADRLLQAEQLYKQGRVSKILITSGDIAGRSEVGFRNNTFCKIM